MFRLNIQQNLWVLLAVMCGTALVLSLVLAYLAIWQPREPRGVEPADGSHEQRGRAALPWILIVTYISVAVWGLVYTISKALNPPNW